MAKTGRPKVEIDWDKLEKLCRYPFTQEEIAWLLDVSVDSLTRKIPKHFGISFAELQNKKRSEIKAMLLTKQMDIALKGNVTMLIWLGKQFLGQSDKQAIDHSVDKDSRTITLSYATDKGIKSK